ncbi:MAG: hypothetical protein LBC99_06970 [Spirochaetota bacterium]|jgi:hypothetical protein|nr:hypothetical protein [Spirochaetota bacterium]
MERPNLPLLRYKLCGTVSESDIVYDRENSLLVIALSRENDYSGEFINIGRVCIALGESMDAVDIQIQFSEGETKKVSHLAMPEGQAARVIFPESSLPVEDLCSIEVHPDLSVLHFCFADLPPNEALRLSVAQNVVFEVTNEHTLAGLWVSRIQQR